MFIIMLWYLVKEIIYTGVSTPGWLIMYTVWIMFYCNINNNGIIVILISMANGVSLHYYHNHLSSYVLDMFEILFRSIKDFFVEHLKTGDSII